MKRAKYKSKGYKELIKLVAQTSKYHDYEVEDVLNHLIGNIQVLLSQGNSVKLSGLGVIKVQKLVKKNTLDNNSAEDSCYTAYRMSLASDVPMKNFLKEHYNAESNTSELALPDLQ
jgi:nucleoid DNA-binding protein